MVKDILNALEMEEVTTEKEVADLARRILQVYGKAEFPVLDQEIERMAKLLAIPFEEVLPHG